MNTENFISFFKKNKKEYEEFVFPKKNFEIPDRAKIIDQTHETNIELILNFDTFLKECEKSFEKSALQYESLKKSEKNLTEKQKKTKEDYDKKISDQSDDLKQLRSGYHKLRYENESFEKTISTLKKTVSKKVEEMQGDIHNVVIEFAKSATTNDASLMTKYEETLTAAEQHFSTLENTAEDAQSQMEIVVKKNQSLEAELENEKQKILEQEDQISKYKLEFAQKSVELTKLEALTREKSEVVRDESKEMQEKIQDKEYWLNMLQVEKDSSHANAEALKKDIEELNTDIKEIKTEQEATLLGIFEKDELIQKGKEMVKQIMKELNVQKRKCKEFAQNLAKKDKEIENLKFEVEDLSKTLENSKPKSSQNIGEKSQSKADDLTQDSSNKLSHEPEVATIENESKQYTNHDMVQQYTIEIQNFKDTIIENKEKLREKDDYINQLNLDYESDQSKIKELENKRKYGLNEIKSLKQRITDFENSRKQPLASPPLFDGKDLRNHSKNTPNTKGNNNFTFDASCTNFDFYVNSNTVTNIINANGNIGALIINPTKFDNFSKRLNQELKQAYYSFLEVMPDFYNENMKASGIEIEKSINSSMQLVNGFTMYVNEKLEELNQKSKQESNKGNLNCLEDVFKKRYSKT